MEGQEQDPRVKSVPVKSICWLCRHGQLMGVEIETPAVHPLTGAKGMQVNHRFQAICHSRGGGMGIWSNTSVLACSDFEQRPQADPVELRAPEGVEVANAGPETPQVN